MLGFVFLITASMGMKLFLQDTSLQGEAEQLDALFADCLTDSEGNTYQTYDQTISLLTETKDLRDSMQEGDTVTLEGVTYDTNGIDMIVENLTNISAGYENNNVLKLSSDYSQSFISNEEYQSILNQS